MRNTLRIMLFAVTLIGGTGVFGYWAWRETNTALATIDIGYVANAAAHRTNRLIFGHVDPALLATAAAQATTTARTTTAEAATAKGMIGTTSTMLLMPQSQASTTQKTE